MANNLNIKELLSKLVNEGSKTVGYGAIIGGLVYATGFIVINSSLLKVGIYDLSLLRTGYISAGTAFLVLYLAVLVLSVSVFFYLIIPSFKESYTTTKKAILYLRGRGEEVKDQPHPAVQPAAAPSAAGGLRNNLASAFGWFTVWVVSPFWSVVRIVIGLAILYFVSLLVSWLSLYFNGDLNDPASFALNPFTWIAPIFNGEDGVIGPNPSIFWWTITHALISTLLASMAYQILNSDDNETITRVSSVSFAWMLVIIYFFTMLVVYAQSVYPTFPQALGGGLPLVVQLVGNEELIQELHEIGIPSESPTVTTRVDLLSETSKEYIIGAGRGGVSLSKGEIKAVRYHQFDFFLRPEDRAVRLVDWGTSAMQDHKYDIAITHFSEAVRTYDCWLEGHVALGDAYLAKARQQLTARRPTESLNTLKLARKVYDEAQELGLMGITCPKDADRSRIFPGLARALALSSLLQEEHAAMREEGSATMYGSEAGKYLKKAVTIEQPSLQDGSEQSPDAEPSPIEKESSLGTADQPTLQGGPPHTPEAEPSAIESNTGEEPPLDTDTLIDLILTGDFDGVIFSTGFVSELFGENHSLVVKTYQQLADKVLEVKGPKKAESIYLFVIEQLDKADSLDNAVGAKVNNRLGQIYMEKGSHQSARESFIKAIELADDAPIYNSEGDVVLGKNDRAAMRGNLADLYIAVAKSAAENGGAPSEIIGLYNDATAQLVLAEFDGDESPGLFIKRGRAYVQAGSFDLARDDFTRAMELGSVDIRNIALFHLARVEALDREVEVAIDLLITLFGEDSSYVLLVLRNSDFSNIINQPEFLSFYEKTPAFAEATAEAAKKNSLGLRFLQDNTLEEAVSLLKTAVELDPQNPNYHQDLASAYERSGQTEDTIYHYERSLALGVEDVDVYCKLGQVYDSAGDLGRSQDNWEICLASTEDPRLRDSAMTELRGQ